VIFDYNTLTKCLLEADFVSLFQIDMNLIVYISKLWYVVNKIALTS
jgi:hypothetical protein